jgi:predicted aldo/keto reductase-like oxidoreductase
MLEESLRRLQTDHLDLWQVHGMCFENDPELFIRANGAAEALAKAKKDGKTRFVGFTGHQNPMVHLGMLNTGFPFDSVQMPLNAFDHGFIKFRTAGPARVESSWHCSTRHEASERAWRAHQGRRTYG